MKKFQLNLSLKHEIHNFESEEAIPSDLQLKDLDDDTDLQIVVIESASDSPLDSQPLSPTKVEVDSHCSVIDIEFFLPGNPTSLKLTVPDDMTIHSAFEMMRNEANLDRKKSYSLRTFDNNPLEDHLQIGNLRKPIRLRIQEIDDAPESQPTKTYRFLLDDDIFTLDIADGERVGSVKTRIAELKSCDCEAISLLWLGKTLRDTMVISALRIQPTQHIVVYIRWMKSIGIKCAHRR